MPRPSPLWLAVHLPDLPLDALAAGVEASLREMLGETPAPAPQPDADFVLS